MSLILPKPADILLTYILICIIGSSIVFPLLIIDSFEYLGIEVIIFYFNLIFIFFIMMFLILYSYAPFYKPKLIVASSIIFTIISVVLLYFTISYEYGLGFIFYIIVFSATAINKIAYIKNYDILGKLNIK